MPPDAAGRRLGSRGRKGRALTWALTVAGVGCIGFGLVANGRHTDRAVRADVFDVRVDLTASVPSTTQLAATIEQASTTPTTATAITTTPTAITTTPITASTTSAPTPTGDVPSAGVPPAAVSFPRHDLLAAITPTAVGPDGRLLIPEDQDRIGWWVGGASPGDPQGSVVLAGHVDSHRFGVGAFRTLLDLQVGDAVVLVDVVGAQHRYEVVAREQIDKDELPPELFEPSTPPQLVMITCGGSFDERTRHYADNVIVVAMPVVAVPVAGDAPP